VCSAIHPERAIECRIDGSHPKHVFGFGKTMVTWPNEDFHPIPARIGRGQLVEMAKRIKEAQRSYSPV
jgi:hypothetical protein